MHARRDSGRRRQATRKPSATGGSKCNICAFIALVCLGFSGFIWYQLSVLHEGEGANRAGTIGRSGRRDDKVLPHEPDGVAEKQALAELEEKLGILQRRKEAIQENIKEAEVQAEELEDALYAVPSDNAHRGGGGGGGGKGDGGGGGGDTTARAQLQGQLKRQQFEEKDGRIKQPPAREKEPAVLQHNEQPIAERRILDPGGVKSGSGGGGSYDGVPGMVFFEEGAARPVLTDNRKFIRQKLPLVIGGTDGSGTRGVVAMLQRFGVPMVIEDGGTLDVHGTYMTKGGWPMVVHPVLKATHSTSYEANRVGKSVYDDTIKALNILKSKMVGKISTVPTSGASWVEWGLKAPVSLLLVPFFSAAWGGARFLHVVRDGRDLAFSGNQSPVVKFYEDTYPKGDGAKLDVEVKAIRLWSDWNAELYEWASAHRDGSSFDYLLLHTEDLLAEPPAKFAALKDLSEFVGSPLSDDQLCCIAHEKAKDMGTHNNRKELKTKVTERFGKWKKKVEGKRQLEEDLHDRGARSLKLFGYEPPRALRVTVGYDCSVSPSDTICKTVPPEVSNKRAGFVRRAGKPAVGKPGAKPVPSRRRGNPRMKLKVPTSVTDTADCKQLKMDYDLKGADIHYVTAEDHLECCRYCKKEDKCTSFALDYKYGLCYLKTNGGNLTSKKGVLSGTVSK